MLIKRWAGKGEISTVGSSGDVCFLILADVSEILTKKTFLFFSPPGELKEHLRGITMASLQSLVKRSFVTC